MKYATMKTLGTNGRFANQLFQYAFLRFYAKRIGVNLETPAWEGQKIFGHAEPAISRDLPAARIHGRADWAAICEAYPSGNVDFWGYFQETAYYVDDKTFFRSLFIPCRESELIRDWAAFAGERGRPVIGVHLRYGDYGYGNFYETPIGWVRDVLEQEWDGLDEPLLYVATDDHRAVKLLKRYNPVTWQYFSVEAYPAYYYDFWALSRVNHMLIASNSSFSFAAAMLNETCSTFMRPSLSAHKLIPFDPWISPVLLSDSTPWLNFLSRCPCLRRIYNFIRRAIFFRNL